MGWEKAIRVWDAKSGALIKTLEEGDKNWAENIFSDASPLSEDEHNARTKMITEMFQRIEATSGGKCDFAEGAAFGRVLGLSYSKEKYRSLLMQERADGSTADHCQLDEFVRFFIDKSKDTSDDEFRKQIELFTDVTRSNKSRRDALSDIFWDVDIDRSGGIATDELFELGLAFNPQWTRDKCAALFRKIDRNSDGTLSIDEFLAFFGVLCERMSDTEMNKGLTAMSKKAKTIGGAK
jgi:Ca2+-binding EF-hand superfamily protein